MRTPRHVLLARSRTMRAQPTLTEEILWQVLRGSQLGVAFRRQAVVADRYIVDFVAPSIMLVVEVDGEYHTQPAQRRADARRDRDLRRLGYRVVHVSGEMVQHRLGDAVAVVLAAIASACE